MSEITQLIDAQEGDGVDSAKLFAAAYPELRKLAHSRLSGSGPLTLVDTTALVNESWLRLSGQQRLKVESRGRFFAYASQVMRSVIIEHLRQRGADKRGGGRRAVTLDTALGERLAAPEQVLDVHEALESLARLEPRLAQVVEMRYFGGLTEIEIGEVLGLTERTVRRDWEKARLLLASMLD